MGVEGGKESMHAQHQHRSSLMRKTRHDETDMHLPEHNLRACSGKGKDQIIGHESTEQEAITTLQTVVNYSKQATAAK